MNRIIELDSTTHAEQSTAERRRGYYKLVRVGALAAVLLLAIAIAGRIANRPSLACATLAQAAEYVKEVGTMHISARMRTLPKDNFDMIDLKAPLIPVEMWKEFGESPKVRIEKQGRQIAADGKTTTLLVDFSLAKKFNGLAEGCFETLAPLLHPDSLFRRESEMARNSDSDVSVATETGADGREKTILTISAKAQGDFSESDWARNRSIIESDNIRVYTFDAETYRCERMQAFVRTEHGNVLVFETTGIEYDVPIQPSAFHLDVPKTAVWDKEQSEAPAMDNSWMQPDDIARLFYEALHKSDWKTVRSLGSAWLDTPEFHKEYGGLEIISIGEPIKSGLYPGYFVPYEIKLKSGQVKRFRLAVRNDNPDHRWKIDGGL